MFLEQLTKNSEILDRNVKKEYICLNEWADRGSAQKYGYTPVKRNSDLDEIARSMLKAREGAEYDDRWLTWTRTVVNAIEKVENKKIDGKRVSYQATEADIVMPSNGLFDRESAFATMNVDYVGIASGKVNGHFVYVIICVNEY